PGRVRRRARHSRANRTRRGRGGAARRRGPDARLHWRESDGCDGVDAAATGRNRVMVSRIAGRYRQIVESFPRVRAVVAGDLIADEFIYGRVERVSREAPVLILKYDAT